MLVIGQTPRPGERGAVPPRPRSRSLSHASLSQREPTWQLALVARPGPAGRAPGAAGPLVTANRVILPARPRLPRKSHFKLLSIIHRTITTQWNGCYDRVPGRWGGGKLTSN
eukprot:759076-Hanusia_phi.AAC.4